MENILEETSLTFAWVTRTPFWRFAAHSNRMSCAAITLGLLTLSACGVLHQIPIKGSDSAELLPAGRLSWEMLRRGSSIAKAAPQEETAPPRRQRDFRLLLDVDVSDGKGKFTQHLQDGDYISIGGPLFMGPADVDVKFDLLRGSIAVRAANRFGGHFGVDGFIGLGMTELDIRLSEGSVSDSDRRRAYGPLLGATLSYQPLEYLRFFGEGSLHLGFLSGLDSATTTVLDVGASVILSPNVEIVAGWRQMTYESEFDTFDDSDLNLKLDGPLLSLRIVL